MQVYNHKYEIAVRALIKLSKELKKTNKLLGISKKSKDKYKNKSKNKNEIKINNNDEESINSKNNDIKINYNYCQKIFFCKYKDGHNGICEPLKCHNCNHKIDFYPEKINSLILCKKCTKIDHPDSTIKNNKFSKYIGMKILTKIHILAVMDYHIYFMEILLVVIQNVFKFNGIEHLMILIINQNQFVQIKNLKIMKILIN